MLTSDIILKTHIVLELNKFFLSSETEANGLILRLRRIDTYNEYPTDLPRVIYIFVHEA